MMRALSGVAVVLMGAALAAAQTPQPFPTPRNTTPTSKPQTPPTAPPPPAQTPAAPGPGSAPATAPKPAAQPPAEAKPVPYVPTGPPPPGVSAPAVSAAPGAGKAPDLGVPLYPSAVFLTSYDAGRGQRFYLFGVSLSFNEAVAYYRTTLKQRGDMLFESPPTHQFETGRFNEGTMAFPPGVTVKDFTWGGSPGYLNPIKGGQPERFPTIIQIVPATPVK